MTLGGSFSFIALPVSKEYFGLPGASNNATLVLEFVPTLRRRETKLAEPVV